jgi:hypothetical protein
MVNDRLVSVHSLWAAHQFRSRRWPAQREIVCPPSDSQRYVGKPHSRQWSSRQARIVRRSGGEAGTTTHTSVPLAIGAAMFGIPRASIKGCRANSPAPKSEQEEETDDALMRFQQRFVNGPGYHRQIFGDWVSLSRTAGFAEPATGAVGWPQAMATLEDLCPACRLSLVTPLLEPRLGRP